MTLIEIIVVLVIIALLLGLLFPAIHYSRELARRSSCQSNLHQLAVAYQQYLQIHGKQTSYRVPPPGAIHGWAIDVLPFMEEQTLWDGLSGNPILDPASPLPLARKRPYLMACPSAFEGDSSIAGVPPSHYTMIGDKIGNTLADVRIDSRVPWVFSPGEPIGGPSALLPHMGGYNLVGVTDEHAGAARYVPGN